MSFADVLLRVMPTAEEEPARLSVAVDLIQRMHGRLDGIFVTEDEGTNAAWARTLFERAVSRSPLETTWRVVDGRSERALLFQARRSDLCILPSIGATRETSAGCSPEIVALNSGRPVLILPTPTPNAAMSIGQKILIGWNDTREAVRAIHDAMPLLLEAEKVFILTVMADDDLEPLADRRLVEHLRRHGVTLELARRYGDPAEEIAAAARQLDVDMLVIGLVRDAGSGGSTLSEVSQRFVRTASLPVFCSH